MYCAAWATGVDLDDRLRRSRTFQSDRGARSGDGQGDHHCVVFHAHKGEQSPFASCSDSWRHLAAYHDFPDAKRLRHARLGATEPLERISRKIGELRLLKKRRQFQERSPNSPCQWNAHDKPVNQKFERIAAGLVSLSHKSAYGFRV